jgi:tetraacyldisaccharide 4'-kinase
VVGNISVGGNGKTPLVVHLAKMLKQQGFRPGVLSRGYGGKGISYPFSVDQDSKAEEVGDEPVLMYQHIHCPLVVDPQRPRGAIELVDKHQCDVIICDDGLQHYALQRDIEISVMDGQRRCGNHLLLPSGPLREGTWRNQSVDFVVVNGGEANKNEFLMGLEPGELINIKDRHQRLAVAQLREPASALAGIGNPQRFFRLLKNMQVTLSQTLSFVDHHAFSQSDIPQGLVLMTEKDAVKCAEFAHENCWYLPVSASLSTEFDTQLLQKVIQVSKVKKQINQQVNQQRET